MNVQWGKREIVYCRIMKNIPLIPLGGSKTLQKPLSLSAFIAGLTG